MNMISKLQLPGHEIFDERSHPIMTIPVSLNN